MAHMSVIPGNHEIVEIEEELNPGKGREEKDRKSLASNAGNGSSLEEDLNQLFEIFNRRASSHRPSKKNASKKLVKTGGSPSPGHEISERMNLKKALRGLCLSQASEMAAMKHSMKSPRVSEAGKIMTMYRNVVVEDSIISEHSQDDSKMGLLEISLMPEQTTFESFQNVPEKVPSPDLWPSNRNSLGKKAVGATSMENDRCFESMHYGNQTSKTEKPKHAVDDIPDMSRGTPTQIGVIMTSSSPFSSSAMNRVQQVSQISKENRKLAASVDRASQAFLIESAIRGKQASPTSSHSKYTKGSFEPATKFPVQNERFCTSPVVGNQNKINMALKDAHAPTRSPRRFDLDDHILGDSKNSSASSKLVSNEVTDKSAKEFGRVVQKPKGEKVSRSTRNAQHLAKPLIKTKIFVKRRSKKKIGTDNDSKTIHSDFNNNLYSTPNSIVCPRCQCDVTNAWKEVNIESSKSHHDSPISPQESLGSPQESPSFYQDSPISPSGSLSGDINSENAISDFGTPEQSSDGLTKTKEILVDSSSNSKSRNMAEFTQSSKSSPDECSSTASVSEQSHMGRPSFCDRPHMSKDIRWEAIQRVKFENGKLGLRNFSLVKKLGCGDIGTVYLAELIGTNCLFAIKVMDNEFLVRRKKITRAQTEKEILRMLDHPFLPTLYCQFTSDNLSCLVMEYCPGGDLHVLRQRQPGRCFTEQAARFYVAEVLLALEYLHMLGVVYRDLKPENILVREDGHIMLSDFDLSLRCAVSPTLLVSSSLEGTQKTPRDSPPCRPLCIEPSCQVTCFTPRLLAGSSKSRKTKPDIASEMRSLLQLVAEPTSARSNSFVGTHEYLSPEIIKGEGHGSAVDWWTFGIFLYELLYGRTPFKGPGNEETLANVVLQNLKFPDSPLVSLQARDLIAALLVKEPENRLGTERGAAEIKQHPFFDGLNWALIRCAVPPELPEPGNYGMSKSMSGSGSREHLEFEVF